MPLLWILTPGASSWPASRSPATCSGAESGPLSWQGEALAAVFTVVLLLFALLPVVGAVRADDAERNAPLDCGKYSYIIIP